jgi:hypothetical protein
MSPNDSLASVYELLQEALTEAALPHAFIGALGAIAWGRPRATTDVDLVALCDEAGLERLRAALSSRGFTEGAGVGTPSPAEPLPDIAIFWAGPKPQVRVDVFLAKVDFEREVIATARTSNIFGRQAAVARPEAMLIYKLLASRGKDLVDVEAIFESRKLAGEALDWELLERWAAEWGIEGRLHPWRTKFGG